MKKLQIFCVIMLATIISCGNLDVVGKDSVKSFDALLGKATRQIVIDEMTGGWVFFAPDGSSKFIWSKNFAESPLHDVMIVFEAKPFIDAGLDAAKLPKNFSLVGNTIMVGTKLGQEVLKYNGDATPLASFEQLVALKRNTIGYHGALDHYGVNLTDGNLFEWAKDMNTNDKDIVFVLNPEPLIAAGVNPNNVAGWAFAKVTVDDANGKPVEVDKLLKPFNVL